MRKVEIVRGIIGIVAFVIAFVMITYSALKNRKQPSITIELYSCNAQVIEQQDEMVSSEDLLKVEEKKQILFDEVEYYAVRSEKELSKNPYFPYATAEYKTKSGELFSVNVETGNVIEYISGDAEKKGMNLSDSQREEVAKKYVNEKRNIENYKLSYKEMNGFYIYDFVKCVDTFKTTDEIKVILLADGTLYMLCCYTLGEFDELDKMYEVKQYENKRGPILDKSQVNKAVQEKIKKQFGDTVTYEEKDMTIVKRRNGEFAVLVVADISDEKGELIAVREQYYVTWE